MSSRKIAYSAREGPRCLRAMIEAVIAGNVSSEDPMFSAYVMSMLVCDTVDALESSRHEDVNRESGYVACLEIRSRQSDLHR